MAPKTGSCGKGASGGGRAGFLNAAKSAAITETIKKEERVLHQMLQRQIDLGRIVLPEGLEEAETRAEEEDAAAAAAKSTAVGQHVEWLLAVHRGAGQAPSGAAAGDTQEQGEQHGGADGSSNDEEERAASEAARLREQLRGISRSLWGALSGGAPPADSSVACTSSAAPGSYTSRSKADYQYSEAAVAAMRSSGELDSTHHRRRDAHTAHVEACARDALLRRGGGGGGGGDSSAGK